MLVSPDDEGSRNQTNTDAVRCEYVRGHHVLSTPFPQLFEYHGALEGPLLEKTR